jgi:Fic family protein
VDRSIFTQSSGTLVDRVGSTGTAYVAFVPAPLPPAISNAELGSVATNLARATYALGELSGIGRILPNPDLLVRPYQRREAIVSSRIEDTHTSYAELVAFEAYTTEAHPSEARDVHNYLLALDYGLRHVETEGISADLIRSMHRHLMTGARGERFATAGEFRALQNHIGGASADPADARYVPPPPDEAKLALEQLIAYLAEDKPETNILVEAAWMHYQFEAIHPFLDGNGRVGRALIPLLFALRHQMAHPLLYLSPYFDRDRGRYYDLLFDVSTKGAWVAWLDYFLTGVADQASVAIALSQRIINLGQLWHDRLRAPRTAHRLADFVHQHGFVNANMARLNLDVSVQTGYNAIRTLTANGILEEFGNRPWGQVFISPELRDIMQASI